MSTAESIVHLEGALNTTGTLMRAIEKTIEHRVTYIESVVSGLNFTMTELGFQAAMGKSAVQSAMRVRASIWQADPEQEMQAATHAYALLGRAIERADTAAVRALALQAEVERVLTMFASLDFSQVTEPINAAGVATQETIEVLDDLLDRLRSASS